MRRQNYVVVSNRVILDRQLYSSTKRIFTAMRKYSGRHGTVRKTVEELAAISGCSQATVQRAIDQLLRYGYIRCVRCYRYSNYFARPVFDSNIYYIQEEELGGSFTLIPVELLTAPITHSAFVVALYVYKTAGRVGRSWASLRNAAKRLDLSKATICRALEVLRRLQLLSRLLCIRKNRSHSCNSYFPTAWIKSSRVFSPQTTSANIFSVCGGLNLNKHPVINKITGVSIKREGEKGVDEFSDLYNFGIKNLFDNPIYFDGTGVKVSAGGEPDLTA